MTKIKYIGFMGAALVLLGVCGGLWVWNTHNKQALSKSSSGVEGAYTEIPLEQTNDPNSIPLNQTAPSEKKSGGLSVAPSSVDNSLGQITPNSSGMTNSNGAGSSSSASSKALDPASFAQYDKYKESESALFGELQPGTGDELTAGKKAAVYYNGWLTDGRLFDQTRADKDGKLQPFVFEMGGHQVIPGWEQGLIGMKVGGTRLIIVPPAVGYGTAGQDPIPGNAVLVFQVQLLAVQ